MSQDARSQRSTANSNSHTQQNYGNPHGPASYPDDSYDEGPSSRHSSGTTKVRPVHEVRFGRVSAAIWENRNEQGVVRYNVTIVRNYKVDEQWRESQSFGRDDLPLVIKTLDQCHTWIFSQRPQQPSRA